MIKKEGSQWCVFTSDGSRKLGCHPTEEQANQQLRAIEASKHGYEYADGELRAALLEYAHGLTDASAKGIWAKVSGTEHPHTACVEIFQGKMEDPHAFCTAVEMQAAGTTPAERAADKKDHAADSDHALSISNVEIFSAGTHNGDSYTERDLDEMVRAFNELDFKPPLKAGHVEDKKGMPSLGWVANLRRAGSKLVADFVDMPKLVYDAIRNKRYNTVSSEVYWDLDRAGKKFGRALKAVALLGAEIPAVAGLKPLHELFTDSSASWKSYDAPLNVGKAGESTTDKEYDMTEEQAKALTDRLDALDAALKSEKEARQAAETKLNSLVNAAAGGSGKAVDDIIRRLEGANSELDAGTLTVKLNAAEARAKSEEEARQKAEEDRKQQAARIAMLEAQQRKELVSRISDACRVPALRPFIANFADLATRQSDVKVYDAEGKEKAALAQVEDLIKYINVNAAKLFLTYSQGGGGSKSDPDPSKEMDRRAKEYQIKNPGASYLKAMQAVALEDPVLAEQYRAASLNVGAA